MKKKNIFITICLSLVILFSVSFIAVNAINYVPLESGVFEGVNKDSTNLSTFLSSVFSFGIAIAVVLAFVMIVYAGIIKMTTDSWTKTETANGIITNALYGLGLALVSYLLLYIINPCLVVWTSSGNCKNTFLYPEQTTSQTSVDNSGSGSK